MTGWCLMRMVTNGPQGEGHHALSYLRDLQSGEKESIDTHQQLLRSFSANWEGNVSTQSFERFTELLDECIDGIKKASGHFSDNDRVALSRAAAEAADTISSWPEKILSGEYRNLGVDSQSQEEINSVARKLLAEGTVLSALRSVAKSRDDSLVSVTQVERDGRKYLVAYFRKEVLEDAGMQHANNWVVQELLSLGLAQLQRLAATVLKSYRGKIEESGRAVLSLFNETLYGNPVLVPKDNLSKIGQGVDLSFVPVERPNLEGVLRAADSAERLVDTAETATSQDAVDASPVADPGGSEPRISGPADLPQASDLATLLTYVSGLSAELEKRWSSLVTDEGNESHKAALNKWYSFISSLKNHIEIQGKRDPREDRSIRRFPMKAEDFKHSSGVPTISETLKEVEVAEVYAVRNLINVMQALRSPTAAQIDLATGVETHWWESGAFSLVRKAAEVAIRLVHRRDQLLETQEAEAAAGSTAGSAVADTILQVSLSRAAMDQGMPEASILYCSLALRSIAARFGVEGNSAEQVAGAIAVRSGGELRVPAERVMKLVRDMAAGADVPVEQIFNLANFWYEAIGSLVEDAFMYTRPAEEEADSK